MKAVSETNEVAVMEVWLNDSPDPKANASWATKGHYNHFAPGVHLFNDFLE